MSIAADQRISDDLRYELADAARVAESGNKPRVLLVFATMLFVLAGIVLVVALRQHESAAQQHRIHNDYSDRIANYELQFAAVNDLQNAGRDEVNEHITNLYSRILQAAVTAGLQKEPTIPKERTEPIRGGALKVTYAYTVQDPSLQNLLAWVEEARAAVPGLEVAALEIAPTPRAWKFNVTFVRWERPS